MMPVLQAEEALETIRRVGIGTGSIEKDTAERYLDEYVETLELYSRKSRKKMSREQFEQTFGAMGLGVVWEPKEVIENDEPGDSGSGVADRRLEAEERTSASAGGDSLILEQ